MAHILTGSLLQMGKGPFCTQTHTLGHNSPSNAALGLRRGWGNETRVRWGWRNEARARRKGEVKRVVWVKIGGEI